MIDACIYDATSKVLICCLFYRGTIPDNLKKYIHGEHNDLGKKQLLALGSRLVLILTSALKVFGLAFFSYCLNSNSCISQFKA